MNNLKLKHPLSIRFADFDLLGHVNNAKYLTYFEMARIEYFEKIIASGRVDWKNEGIILANAVIDFKHPITGYENYFIAVGCTRIGTKSFDLTYHITKEEADETIDIAEGRTVMVCFDYVNRKSIAMKQEWRKAIEEFEGRLL